MVNTHKLKEYQVFKARFHKDELDKIGLTITELLEWLKSQGILEKDRDYAVGLDDAIEGFNIRAHYHIHGETRLSAYMRNKYKREHPKLSKLSGNGAYSMSSHPWDESKDPLMFYGYAVKHIVVEYNGENLTSDWLHAYKSQCYQRYIEKLQARKKTDDAKKERDDVATFLDNNEKLKYVSGGQGYYDLICQEIIGWCWDNEKFNIAQNHRLVKTIRDSFLKRNQKISRSEYVRLISGSII